VPASDDPDNTRLLEREPDISVISPVYLTERYSEELCARLGRALEPVGPYEIVLVDDASPERNRGTLRRLARSNDRVRVVELDVNRGQHAAVLRGLSEARGSRVVVMDADLQDPPEAVPRLIEELSPEIDVVFGGRRGRYESAGRLLTSKLYKWLLHIFAGVPRDAGMFFALSREAVDRLLSFDEARPVVVEMIGRARLKSISIPVERRRREDGVSGYSSAARARMAGTGLWSAVRHRASRRSAT
jgi:polyisoprenyl-phosphate glycosyltransferase